MLFKDWLVINENIESNFDSWVRSIQKYSKPSEVILLKSLGIYVPEDEKYPGRGDIANEFNIRLKTFKEIIIKVLKKKNLENLNWLAFSVGYLVVKTFHEEDLELAIEVTKQRIASGELPKSEIGSKGWMQIGNEALEHVQEYLRQQQEISNRQKEKLKKLGGTLEEDESKDLIQLVAKEVYVKGTVRDELKLYKLPSLNIHPDSVEQAYSLIAGVILSKIIASPKSKIESRKRLLCKYGKGTDWCTANPSGDYDRYYMNNDIFIMHENNHPKYQFTSCIDDGRAGSGGKQFMDPLDRNVSKIKLEEKEFLEKHALKETECYIPGFKIIFSSLESYLSSDEDIKRKIDPKSIVDLVKDKNFKNATKKQFIELILNINIDDIPSNVFKSFLRNLPDNFNIDALNDKKIFNSIVKLQYVDYEDLDKKISKERLEKFLNNYKNDLFDDEINPKYEQEVQNSRKSTIRNLLIAGHSLESMLSILSFLVKKISIGPAEAYTIFDTVISQIQSAFSQNLISTPTALNSLDLFAKILGKENINKIDLNRFQERMKVKLIPEGNKFRIDKTEDIGAKRITKSRLLALGSAKDLMIRFLEKHDDRIITSWEAEWDKQ